ncbi:small ribosomal subunit protein eS7-like [Petaurus breviceps papuanus]|uniref:small ribosomal subunit protein eS7-like n=1 Tax=Petaurus breviceps papuanus TaxID=3040969 RepID=UPI0036DE0616
MTYVHDAILEDLVFTSEIVGKRIRVKLDGSRLIKIHLDEAQPNNVETELCPTRDSIWSFLGKDTGVVCHFLLQLILQMRKLRNRDCEGLKMDWTL